MPTAAYLQAHYKPVGDLISAVGLELKLGNNTAPFSSTDSNWMQLVRLSVETGQDFMRQWDWGLMQTRYNFSTPGSVPAVTPPADFYFVSMPSDFLRLLPQTAWNFSSQLPFAGPISPQIKTWLSGRVGNSATLFLGFAEQGGDLALWPNPPPLNQTLFFEYMSNAWVQNAGNYPVALGPSSTGRYVPGFAGTGGGQTSFPYYSSPSDLVLFDPQLYSRALKLRFMTENGFDTTAAQADFDASWDSVVGADTGAAKANMNGAGTGFRYLDGTWNVPITGYGGS
jgi:hypothetical protein